MNDSIHIDNICRDALPSWFGYATHSGNHRNKSLDVTDALALGMARRRSHICLEAFSTYRDQLLAACIHGSRSSSFCYAATVSAHRNAYTSLGYAARSIAE